MESVESVECGAAPGAGSADPSGIPGWMRLRVHGNGRGKSRERTGPAREIPGIRSFPAFPGGILPSGKDFGIKKIPGIPKYPRWDSGFSASEAPDSQGKRVPGAGNSQGIFGSPVPASKSSGIAALPAAAPGNSRNILIKARFSRREHPN